MSSALDKHVAKALGEAESAFLEIMQDLQNRIDALEDKRETAERAAKIDALASKRDRIENILDAIDAASAEFAE